MTTTLRRLGLFLTILRTWNDVRTLTRLGAPQLDLLLLVLGLVGVVAEELVHPALVSQVGDHHQEWEHEQGDHRLPHVHLVLGVGHQDDDQPDVGKHGEQGGDAEHGELLDPEICFRFVETNTTMTMITNLLVSLSGMPETQTAEMASRLKAADPTMVLGPRASDSKLLPIIPMMAKRISGAEEPDKIV